jgi:glycyl-tRNA synthetase beta chain
VADKIDTIAAYFAIGEIPTGSADPYGLRRAAIGIVSILVSEREPLSVGRLTEIALRALGEQMDLERAPDDVVKDVLEFIRQRLAIYLRETGIRYDLVEAALAVGVDDIFAAKQRADALQALSESDSEFLTTVIACTRPINIAKDFEGADVDPGLFSEEAEASLWEAYQAVVAEADSVSLTGLFGLFTTRLRAQIDAYFEAVLVMAEEAELRQNRLAMCWTLSQLFRRLADFSLIVQA